MTEYELVPLFDRTPDGTANGVILFDIYFRGAIVGCQRTWAQAHAHIDFLQSDDDLFWKAAIRPFRMMKFYKDRFALNVAGTPPIPTEEAAGRTVPYTKWSRR